MNAPRLLPCLLALLPLGCTEVGTTRGRPSPDTAAPADADTAAPGDSAAPDSIDAPDSADSIDAIDDTAPDPIDAIDDAVDATDAPDLADLADSADSTDSAEPPDSTDAIPPDAAEDTADTADAGPDTSRACNPPLALTPSPAWTQPRELVTFAVTGGTGAPRFELVEGSVGASIHPTLGIYLAGSVESATDLVRVTDLGCEGVAEAEVHIVPRLAVAPHAATVAPGGALTLTVSGGSGARRYALVANASGGQVDNDGRYTAGPTAGLDRLRVTDIETNAFSEVEIAVVPGAALAVVPPVVALPVGARWRLATVAGSGSFDVAIDGLAATYESGWLTATTPGEVHLALEDRHTGERATAQVIVVDPLAFARYPAGDGTLNGVALNADLDGDGHVDALLGVTEADVGHLNAGGLYVYRGTADGLDPTPARVFGGDDRSDNLARSAALADLDQDGALDLLLGSPFADPSGTNVGLVRLYRGVPDAPGTFFEPDAARTFVGDDAGDAFGTSVGACDFNGDGWLDLAVGANLAEDNTQAGLTDSGGLVLWLGSKSGFATNPDQRLWGERPNANGAWVPSSGVKLGANIATGDFDGDGLCDLATSSLEFSTGAGRSSDGAVWLFRGKGPDALSAGGLEAHARLAWAGLDADAPTSRLGNSLAMGDLDGDGLVELVVGQHGQKVGALTNHGVVRVFRGKPFPDAATPTSFVTPTTADWTWSGGGGQSSDLIGYTVAVGDWDGVAPLDLFVTGLDDELTGGPAGAGVIYVLPGVADATPSGTAVALLAGDGGGQRFGTLFTPMGDLDGDGLGELVVRAAADSTEAPRLGRTLLAWGDPAKARVTLGAPQLPAGSRVGQAVALIPDLDGDGHAELAVGAPLAQANLAVSTTVMRAGVVTVHRGTAEGFATEAAQRIETFPGHATNDGLGESLVGLDFDGDGIGDLAALSSRDSTGSACSPARSTSAAVHVFRGKADGTLSATPSFTYWGEQASQRMDRVATADIDGDGKDDLLIGASAWDGPDATAQANVGALVVVRGQALTATLVNRCTSDRVFFGPAANDLFGSAVAPLGDLDEDGCEDFAVGARGEDVPAVTNPGVVRVVFGWGASCADDEPRALAFSSFAAGAAAGGALAGGDLDGDGALDLAIGAPSYTQTGNALGATWVLLGERVMGLAARATAWTDLARPVAADLHRFAPADSTLDQRVEGRLSGELFGTTVAVLNARNSSYGSVVVASPRSDFGGTPRAGAVLVYPWTADGLAPTPSFALGGETTWTLTELGASLLLDEREGGTFLVVGTPVSRLLGLDEGAALSVPLP